VRHGPKWMTKVETAFFVIGVALLAGVCVLAALGKI
jgi:hypothetical protein